MSLKDLEKKVLELQAKRPECIDTHDVGGSEFFTLIKGSPVSHKCAIRAEMAYSQALEETLRECQFAMAVAEATIISLQDELQSYIDEEVRKIV